MYKSVHGYIGTAEKKDLTCLGIQENSVWDTVPKVKLEDE